MSQSCLNHENKLFIVYDRDCANNIDEDSRMCCKNSLLIIDCTQLSSIVLLNLVNSCNASEIYCVSPQNGPICISKSFVCDGIP